MRIVFPTLFSQRAWNLGALGLTFNLLYLGGPFGSYILNAYLCSLPVGCVHKTDVALNYVAIHVLGRIQTPCG